MHYLPGKVRTFVLPLKVSQHQKEALRRLFFWATLHPLIALGDETHEVNLDNFRARACQ